MELDDQQANEVFSNVVEAVTDKITTWTSEALAERDNAKKLLAAWIKWARHCGAHPDEFSFGDPIYGSLVDKTKEFLAKGSWS